MSARIRRVARDGDPSGLDYSGRSEAAQAIVTAWANHEAASGRPLDPTRIPTGLRTLLLDPRCGGGRYYRERGLPGSAGVYVPRKPADTEGRLDHDWRRAVELVTTRPAVGDHSTARLEIAEIRGALDDDPKRWAGQAGPTDRIVLEFLLAKAHDLGSLCPPASAREVADGTGISRTAASNALNRLCAEKAWLRLERPSAGVHANVYRLRRPTRRARASTLSSAAEAGLERSLTRARLGPPGSSVPARPRRLPAVHDAFVHGRGLGRTSRRIWELLTDVGLTARDIVEVTGLHPRTVRRRLEDLQAAGLASWSGLTATWVRDPSSDLDAVAVQLGVDGTLDRRHVAYRLEQVGYATFVWQYQQRRGYRVERGRWNPDQAVLDGMQWAVDGRLQPDYAARFNGWRRELQALGQSVCPAHIGPWLRGWGPRPAACSCDGLAAA